MTRGSGRSQLIVKHSRVLLVKRQSQPTRKASLQLDSDEDIAVSSRNNNDLRRPREDNRRPRDDNRRPREDNRRPREDNRRPRDDNRRPRDDNRRPREARTPSNSPPRMRNNDLDSQEDGEIVK